MQNDTLKIKIVNVTADFVRNRVVFHGIIYNDQWRLTDHDHYRSESWFRKKQIVPNQMCYQIFQTQKWIEIFSKYHLNFGKNNFYGE